MDEDNLEEPWAMNIRRSVERSRKPARGILKSAFTSSILYVLSRTLSDPLLQTQVRTRKMGNSLSGPMLPSCNVCVPTRTTRCPHIRTSLARSLTSRRPTRTTSMASIDMARIDRIIRYTRTATAQVQEDRHSSLLSASNLRNQRPPSSPRPPPPSTASRTAQVVQTAAEVEGPSRSARRVFSTIPD